MKKFITLLTSITFVGSITTNVISCKQQRAQIQLILDGKGAVDDLSFNQLTWEGIKRFGKDTKKTIKYFNPKDIGWNTEDDRYQQYQEYRKAYKTAFENGSEIVVANGFYHSVSVTDFVLQNRSKPVIIVDAELDATHADKTNELTNVAPLLFKSEQSAFVAGIIAAAYLNKNKNTFLKDGKKELKFASFGGTNVATVVNYMAGLHAAYHWWKAHISDKASEIMQLIYPEYKEAILPVVDITPHEDEKAFTGTFLKDGKDKQKAKELIDLGADIIMPVAGIQTADVLDYIGTELQNRIVNVIGVDSDQRKLYNNIIISALKNLDKATYEALDIWYKKKNNEETKKWFQGNKPISKGLKSESGEIEDWVGVISNEISNDKIAQLIELLSTDIQKVTEWWDVFYGKENVWSIIVKADNDIKFE